MINGSKPIHSTPISTVFFNTRVSEVGKLLCLDLFEVLCFVNGVENKALSLSGLELEFSCSDSIFTCRFETVHAATAEDQDREYVNNP